MIQILTPHRAEIYLIIIIIIIAVDDHGAQVRLQHGAVVLDHGLSAVAHGASGSHGSSIL